MFYRAESLSTLFDSDVTFDFVINCAGETKLGQSDAVRSVILATQNTNK